MAGRGHHGDEHYVVQHVPLVILDPSSSSSGTSSEHVPQTPPPGPGTPAHIPAPPSVPPPPIPPPPQSPPPQSPQGSHSDSSDQHPIRTPVRFPTVSDDSDSDAPIADPTPSAPRGRGRTRATARKSIGNRPTRPLAPRDPVPRSTFEFGESSRPPSQIGQISGLAADVGILREAVHETRWLVQDAHYKQEEMMAKVKAWFGAGRDRQQEMEDRLQAHITVETQHHTQMLSQIDQLQRRLIKAAGIAFAAVFVMMLPLFWR